MRNDAGPSRPVAPVRTDRAAGGRGLGLSLPPRVARATMTAAAATATAAPARTGHRPRRRPAAGGSAGGVADGSTPAGRTTAGVRWSGGVAAGPPGAAGAWAPLPPTPGPPASVAGL